MRVQTLALFCILAVTRVAHGVTITSVTPNSGPASGGTAVTVKGTGFAFCPICSPPLPAAVIFGGTDASSVEMRDENTLVVHTPAHAPGTVDVTVAQWDGEVTLARAFTFTEAPRERILLPLYTQPVFGAYGSEFRTDLRIANRGRMDRASVYGLEPLCILSACPPWNPETPLVIESGSALGPGDLVPNGTPGRFIDVPSTDVGALSINLRAYDVTRAAFNFGTEIPVVHEREFKTRIVLQGVPTDPRFRNTLRIYSVFQQYVTVTVEGHEPVTIPLTRGASDLYSPPYAMFSDFPSGGSGEVRVVVERAPSNLPAEMPIWAFVSVTNNETQLITTITPQP